MGIHKLIAITGNNVGLHDGETVQDTSPYRVWQPLDASSIALMLGQMALPDEIGGDGQESTIVLPELIAIHLVELASALDKGSQIVVGVVTTETQARVAFVDLITEPCQGGIRGVITSLAVNVLPGLSFETSIAKSPLNGLNLGNLGPSSMFINIIEEQLESQSIFSESRSLLAVDRRHVVCSGGMVVSHG